MNKGDRYYGCGYTLCKKNLHIIDDNISVVVTVDCKSIERKRFCCLDHLSKWAEHRENFPLTKKVLNPKVPVKGKQQGFKADFESSS